MVVAATALLEQQIFISPQITFEHVFRWRWCKHHIIRCFYDVVAVRIIGSTFARWRRWRRCSCRCRNGADWTSRQTEMLKLVMLRCDKSWWPIMIREKPRIRMWTAGCSCSCGGGSRKISWRMQKWHHSGCGRIRWHHSQGWRIDHGWSRRWCWCVHRTIRRRCGW